MKRIIILLFLLPLCGCAREVSPISALALDKIGEEYKLTVEVVRQDTLDDIATPSYLSAQGKDMTELLTNIEHVLGNEMYLSSAGVLLIDESVAKDGILTLSDYFCTDSTVRLSLRIAVVRNASAAEMLALREEVFALSDLLETSVNNGTSPDISLYQITDALHANGTAILPALYIDEFGQAAPAGTAVFKNAKISCYLDGNAGGQPHA